MQSGAEDSEEAETNTIKLQKVLCEIATSSLS